jgi:hypothetical protein
MTAILFQKLEWNEAKNKNEYKRHFHRSLEGSFFNGGGKVGAYVKNKSLVPVAYVGRHEDSA